MDEKTCECGEKKPIERSVGRLVRMYGLVNDSGGRGEKQRRSFLRAYLLPCP